MNDYEIQEIDKSVEIAERLRAQEADHIHHLGRGSAFGDTGDKRRLDAFTFGMLDALAHRIGNGRNRLRLMVYLHELLQHGPGNKARAAFHGTCDLGSDPAFLPYIAGGRHHINLILCGSDPDTGRFAQLLTDELERSY